MDRYKLIFLLLLFPSLSWGQWQEARMTPIGVGASVSGCTYTSKLEYTTTGSGIIGAYDTTTDRYCLGGTFTVGESGFTIRKASALLYKRSSGAQTLTVFACDADCKSNCVEADQTIDVSALTADTGGEWVSVTWATGKALSATTQYCITQSADGIDATNNYVWIINPSGSENLRSNDTASCGNATWNSQETSCEPALKVYSCE